MALTLNKQNFFFAPSNSSPSLPRFAHSQFSIRPIRASDQDHLNLRVFYLLRFKLDRLLNANSPLERLKSQCPITRITLIIVRSLACEEWLNQGRESDDWCTDNSNIDFNTRPNGNWYSIVCSPLFVYLRKGKGGRGKQTWNVSWHVDCVECPKTNNRYNTSTWEGEECVSKCQKVSGKKNSEGRQIERSRGNRLTTTQ